MDLVPALAGGLRALAVLQGRSGLGPAGAVRGDFFQDRLTEVVPQVPPVSDLDGVRESPADRFGVGGRAVPADDLHPGVGAKPGFQHPCGAAGQDVDAFTRLGVDQHGGVAVTSAQGEVVHPHHPGHPRRGQDTQGGVPRQVYGQSG